MNEKPQKLSVYGFHYHLHPFIAWRLFWDITQESLYLLCPPHLHEALWDSLSMKSVASFAPGKIKIIRAVIQREKITT